jgi:hypothetical protein
MDDDTNTALALRACMNILDHDEQLAPMKNKNNRQDYSKQIAFAIYYHDVYPNF